MSDWSAFLVESERRDGQVQVGIVFSDGTQKIYRGYRRSSLDDAGLSQLAASEIQGLLTGEGKPAITLPLGSLIPKPSAPEPPDPPTQEALDRAAFFEAFRVLHGRLTFVSVGLLAADDEAVTEARTAAAALWKKTYLP